MRSTPYRLPRSSHANGSGLFDTGVSIMPGFLHSEAVEQLTAEADLLAPRAHPSDVTGTPYLDFPDESSPAGHPRRTLVRSSLRAIAYDVFAPTHACVYRYADPLGALNIAVIADGAELGCLAPIGDTVPTRSPTEPWS